MLPDGLQYLPDIVPNPEQAFARIRDEVAWTGQMRARETASMGVPYNYAGASYPVADWHPVVRRIARVASEHLGFEPTNCLLNYYPTGTHSMGWHRDDVSILAPDTAIGIVSLGAPRPLRLRTTVPDGFAYEEVLLEPGSLLIMSQQMQEHWKHALKRCPGVGGRISLSLRHIVHWEESPPMAPRWGEEKA